MIALAKPLRRNRLRPLWQRRFLRMLPVIRSYAKRAFRYLGPEACDDAVQEVVANAFAAYVRLVQLKKAALAYPTVLARYGVAQVRSGRRVGNPLRVRDVLSPYAQKRKGFAVKRLDHFNPKTGQWSEAIVEDYRTPVPDQVAFRIDFPDWLTTQTRRNRRIAEVLALGNSTAAVAKRFRLSPARISQLRQELYNSWQTFHGEPVAADG